MTGEPGAVPSAGPGPGGSGLGGSGLDGTALLPVIEDAVPEAYRAEAEARAAAARAAAATVPLPPSAPLAATVPMPPLGDNNVPPAPPAIPEPPAAPPIPSAATGWTVTGLRLPAAEGEGGSTASGATSVGGGLRGRLLAVEGGYGGAGRRGWGRGGSGQAQVLSAMLAAVSPQTLLAADAVDAVHLPSASDPHTVVAHLRAAARHPGPLLLHLGGHLVLDKRGGGLHLTLRDSKPGTVRQDGLAWQAVAAELRARPADWDTLVIADLSADQAAWPLLQASPTPLVEGLPLWAVVSPDAEQIGTFTRALIETLHGGRPGAGPILAPEQLRSQVHSVLRPDVLVFASHGSDRPVFRNTARQQGADAAGLPTRELPPAAAPAAVAAPVAAPVAMPQAARPEPAGPAVERVAAGGGPVSLVKPDVPPTPPRPVRPVSLAKAAPEVEPAVEPEAEQPVQIADAEPVDAAATDAAVTDAAVTDAVPVDEAPADAVPVEAVPTDAVPPQAAPAPPDDYREALGRIARSAEAGEYAKAAGLALALEQTAVAANGAISEPVLMIRQIRAHVARLAGESAQAATLYREVALVMIAAQGTEDPETQRAVTNAEACWRAIADREQALKVAPEILELRAHIPGPDGRKLRASERYLAQLAVTPAQ